MAEGFRFMPLGIKFGSVHGLLRCNINTGVHARTRSGRGADASLRDVTIAQIGNGASKYE